MPDSGAGFRWFAVVVAALLGLCGCGGGGGGSDTGAAATVNAEAQQAAALAATQTSLRALGQALFNDTNLSTPPGTACASCHQAVSGFSSLNGSTLGVARGSLPTSIGLRAPSQAAYSSENPRFGFVTTPQGNLIPAGGQFWDGRADTLAQQALLPFMNPLEMNNADATTLVSKVAAAGYARQFTALFGAAALSNPTQALAQIGQAIQAFESAGSFDAFSSKYDAVVLGKASFTAAEQSGLALFQNPRVGCAGCHRLNPGSGNPRDSLFTNHNYTVEGIPRNTRIPANAVAGFFDLGLCGPERTPPVLPAGVTASSLCGAFQVPSLRNAGKRPALMHNGFFSNLTDVVSFYATRNTDPQRWYGAAAIPNDLPAQYQANLETRKPPFNNPANAGPVLSPAQVADVVAFLNTLNDGFLP